MSLRRNVITLMIWISVVAIFTIHVILTKRKDEVKYDTMNARSINYGPQGPQINTHDHLHSKKEESGVLESLRGIFDFPYSHSSTVKSNIKKSQLVSSNISNLHLNFEESKLENNEKEANLRAEIKNLKDRIENLQTVNKQLRQNEDTYVTQTKSLTLKLNEREKKIFPRLNASLPWIFAVTPTYSRYTQKAELVRLSQTLMLVTNFHWIIVEDSNEPTILVTKFLKESGLRCTHLNIRTPKEFQRKKGQKYNKHHRGLSQRNMGLSWIRENVNIEKTPGVVYFMDDDNTYHLKLFDVMRWTKRVAAWPVAFTGGIQWAGPISSAGKITSFRTNWATQRKFPVDMAGFAVNINYLKDEKPDVEFRANSPRGRQETTFLEELITMEKLEPIAENYTDVLVWHTRTENPKENIKGEREMRKLEANKTLIIPTLEV